MKNVILCMDYFILVCMMKGLPVIPVAFLSQLLIISTLESINIVFLRCSTVSDYYLQKNKEN